MMREKTYDYPFTAIVGQEPMKEAILINLVNPSAGGVLIRGQKGTAKTTAVRAIPGLMKDCRVVEIPANATKIKSVCMKVRRHNKNQILLHIVKTA